MTWITMLRNRVSGDLLEITPRKSTESVTESFFLNLEINGELDGYFVSTYRAEPCVWDKKQKQWGVCLNAPDNVKLVRLLLEW